MKHSPVNSYQPDVTFDPVSSRYDEVVTDNTELQSQLTHLTEEQ